MQPLLADRVELDRCLRCKATWFDGGELEHVSGKQGAPSMNRPHPACRCPACPGDLWFARLRHFDVLACVGCGGCFVTDAQLQLADTGRPASAPRRAMQFICVRCKDRYAISTGQRVATGIACQRCAPHLPPAPPEPSPSQGGTNPPAELPDWVAVVAIIIEVLSVF